MLHALKPNWNDEPAFPAEETGALENVVRFEAGQRRNSAADYRPEVADVLAALQRAAEHLRRLDGRTAEAEALARDFEARATAADERARAADEHASALEHRLIVAEDSARAAERKFLQISEWHAEKVAQAQAELEEARATARRDRARVADLERGATEQQSAMQSIVKDAVERIFSAETRAIEASRDFEALRDYIKVNFGG